MVKVQEITEDKQRIEECLQNNYEVWGPPLTLSQYFDRERQLHEIHTRNGLTHRTFAIIDEDTEKAVAACEVLSRPLYNAGDGISKDHCIASVFTSPDYRGQGYCPVLINEVLHLFSNNTKDQVSLWSDVGDYYARFGFNFPPSLQETPPWNSSIVCKFADNKPPMKSQYETLGIEDTLSQIVPEHQRLLLRETDNFYNECNQEINICTVMPHRGLYEQLQFRALFTANCMGLKIPKAFSARTSDGHGWISWTYMFGSNKIMVLGLYGSANEMAQLLLTAAHEGAEYNCVVELYESSIIEQNCDIDELVAAIFTTELDIKVIERKQSLPMSIGSGIYLLPGGYAWY